MLGQIALLEYTQLRYLYIQVHFLLETLIACGKHFDLGKGQRNLVHIFGRTDGAFARHYLADKFLLALYQLIEVSVKGLLGNIAIDLNFWEHIALPFNAPLPLFKVSRSFFADSSIHALRFLSLLLRLLSFDFSLCILLAQAGQYFDIPELGTYSTPHTVQFLGFNAVHRFVGVICNSPTKPMNL